MATRDHSRGRSDSTAGSAPIITAYLFHARARRSRETEGQRRQSFVGSYVLGMGFTFDDTETKGVANPIALMHELIKKEPRNAERIFPYIGGEEVNDSPTHAHHRYVINFGEMTRGSEEVVGLDEDCGGEGQRNEGSHSTAEWWHFERLRPELDHAIRGLKRVLVRSSRPFSDVSRTPVSG